MQKPVVFFSHASRDRDAVDPIRRRILEVTGNAIDIFMSSDGSSIPFGRNWLKEIVDALRDCRLMFVWMTPTSVRSNWIPFESGHAYARGIRVIPVGLLGVSVSSIGAPINLLQGFDVTSGRSLNNVIAVINDEFQLTFPDAFSDDFYTTSVENQSHEFDAELLEYVTGLNCTYSTITIQKDNKAAVRNDWRTIFRDILEQHDVQYTDGPGKLYGIGFNVYQSQDRSTSKEFDVKAFIDPLALNGMYRVWTDALQRFYDSEVPYCFIVPAINDQFDLPDDESLIGARLLNSEVSFDTDLPNVLFRFRNILFRILVQRQGPTAKKEMILLVPRDNDGPIPLLSLMELLEARHVLQKRKITKA
ncbi:MAG: toll/interleukin-1 receptor domain-containing protein [Planctomycetota bacterium]